MASCMTVMQLELIYVELFCTSVSLAKRTGPPPFVTGIGVTITVFYVHRHGARNKTLLCDEYHDTD